MASITSSTPNAVDSYNPRSICQIVGYACLAGFLIDMLVLMLPPDVGNVQWRFNTLQQISDRSIILLFGTALVIFSTLGNRRLLKQLSRLCLLAGVLFFLACPLVIADTSKQQQQAVSSITTQATQIQSQIDDAKANPKAAGENVTLADLQKASQQLTDQTSTLMQNVRTTGIKAGVSIVGNLAVIGLSMVGLGRYGMRSRTR